RSPCLANNPRALGAVHRGRFTGGLEPTGLPSVRVNFGKLAQQTKTIHPATSRRTGGLGLTGGTTATSYKFVHPGRWGKSGILPEGLPGLDFTEGELAAMNVVR